MQSCSVLDCSNSNPLTADSSAHYYFFPRHPAFAQQWIQTCGWQPSEIDINNAKICSLHFENDCYTTEIKVIDYMPVYTKLLRFNAVPTLYLPGNSQIVIKQVKNERNQEMIVFSLPESEKSYIELQVQTDLQAMANLNKTANYSNAQLIHLKMLNANMKARIEFYGNLTKKLQLEQKDKAKIFRNLDGDLNKAQEMFKKLKRNSLTVSKQKQILAKVFSESQIKILCGKKKIYWSDEDMAVGYTIRHLSNKRCYAYLTKNLNIPLPGMSTIKRWTVKNEKSVAKKEESETEEFV